MTAPATRTPLIPLFPGNTIYHGPGTNYPYDDGRHGLLDAHLDGATACDVNVRTCRTDPHTHKRTMVAAHYGDWWNHYHPAPGTHIPRRRIENLTLPQVQDLRSNDGGHPILTGVQVLRICKNLGLRPFFEMKPSTWTDDALIEVRDAARRMGVLFATMTIQSYGATEHARDAWEAAALKRMRRAHRLGIPTLLLYRRPVNWNDWGPVLSAVKGSTRGYVGTKRPAHVVRLGVGVSDASVYGCGCGPGTAREATLRVRHLMATE